MDYPALSFRRACATRASAADIQAHYDPEFGFPQSIDIDYYANAVDDVLGLYVTGFRAL